MTYPTMALTDAPPKPGRTYADLKKLVNFVTYLTPEQAALAANSSPPVNGTPSPQSDGEQRRRFELASCGDFSYVNKYLQFGNENTNAAGDREPRMMWDIIRELQDRLGGMPAVCNGRLFVPNSQGGIDRIENTNNLFGFLRGLMPVDWTTRGKGYVTREEFFSEYIRTAKYQFKAIETLPHFPPLKEHFYCGRYSGIAPGDGKRLERFLDFFCPNSSEDRELLRAALVTIFWGGPAGARPMQAFLSADRQPGGGKTAAANKFATLAGGVIDSTNDEEFQRLKSRLLTKGFESHRVGLIDDVKNTLSLSDFDSLVTATVISGHELKHGNGERPNFLTWFLTTNNPEFTEDFAQRTVITEFARPPYSGTWESEINDFIETNRREIIADIAAFFQRPKHEFDSLPRFGVWFAEIIGRCRNPVALRDLILRRQVECSVTRDENYTISECFAKKIKNLGYTSSEKIFVPAGIAAAWYIEATGERISLSTAGRRIKKLVVGKQISQVTYRRTATERGYEWTGPEYAGMSCWMDVEKRIENVKKAVQVKLAGKRMTDDTCSDGF